MPRSIPAPKRVPAKAAKRPARRQPYLKPGDFRRYLQEKTVLIAPGDVASLLAQRDQIVAKIARDCGEHELLRRQLHLAVEVLQDHARERSPQIPYHTISVLTVALLYFMNPIDVIPDFIKDVGTSDDALLVELAIEMGWPGIERYCIWKSIPTANIRGRVRAARKRPR
jgi:uncharacterized membrane protein YkvA (DUF1232 family)